MYTDLQINFIRAFGDKELKKGAIVAYDGCWTELLSHHYADMGFDSDCISLLDRKFNYKSISKIEYPTLYDGIIKSSIGSEPHLFPDVAKKLMGMPYLDRMEVQKRGEQYFIMIDRDVAIRTERINIPFDPCLPLLEQPQAMEKLLSLTK